MDFGLQLILRCYQYLDDRGINPALTLHLHAGNINPGLAPSDVQTDLPRTEARDAAANGVA
jgi:hypothetical protein